MEILMRLAIVIQGLLLPIVSWVCDMIYRKKPPSIPPAKNPLLNLTATTLAKQIRHGEISSQTVVQAYIDRIKEVNAFINAVVEDRFEAALNEAKICDEKLKAGEVTILQLEKEKPLYGIPFTVKESCALKGMSCTGGTVCRRGMKAAADSFVVESLKNAGGIPLCVTNTPELCSGLDAANYLFGRTRNPYDARLSAGGSSGGEGALLGAGASLIGIGSDIAGSIRVPALFDGIFGHKPTPGIISIRGHFPMSDNERFQNYLVVGPMTRYADDLHLAVKVMSSKYEGNLHLDEPVDLQKLTIYYMEDAGPSIGLLETSQDIQQAIRSATTYFDNQHIKVKRLPFGSLAQTAEVGLSMFFGMEDMPKILLDPDDPKHEKAALAELVKSIFGLSQYTKSAIFMQLMKELNGLIMPRKMQQYIGVGEKLRQKFIDLLGNNSVFLYPTFPRPAPYPQLITLELIGGMYCLLVNVFGFPSTHVPLGLNQKGIPVGFQVIAGPHQDRLTLAVAKELEKKFGGWVPPSTS